MRVFITGGGGFIGYHLCEKLAADGHKVFAIDSLNNYYDPNLNLIDYLI